MEVSYMISFRFHVRTIERIAVPVAGVYRPTPFESRPGRVFPKIHPQGTNRTSCGHEVVAVGSGQALNHIRGSVWLRVGI